MKILIDIFIFLLAYITLLVIASHVQANVVITDPTPTAIIAFTNRPAGSDHIYTMNANGTSVSQITNNSGDTGPVAWSFDGSKIAFVVSNNIYVANANGTNQIQLTTTGHAQFPSFSKDGTLIYFIDIVPGSSPPAGYLASMSAINGSGATDFFGNGTNLLADPHVSPDGTKLVFEANLYTSAGGPFEIYECTLSNCAGTATKITHLNDSGIVGEIADPNWSPDGSKLVVSYCPSDKCNGAAPLNVAVINASTGTLIQQVTNFACPQEANDASWSPDGSIIAFEWDSGVAGNNNCQYANNNNATTHVFTVSSTGTNQIDTGQACSNIGCGPRWQPVPHLSTLAYGVVPPTEIQCTNEINALPIKEAVPANTPFNIPPSNIPASFYTNPTPTKGDSQSIPDFAKVDGSYTGTTDEIMRWGACKYGIDENVVRAQAWVESGWQQGGFGDKQTTQAACVQGSFTALWNTSITEPGGTVVSCPNCCYQSWSAWQTKVYYEYTTWPMIMQSTPFAVDYRYADQRSCMNGDYSIYFSSTGQSSNTYATDIASYKAGTDTTGRVLWGCIGMHFSGSWYDSGAQTYISEVQAALNSQPWP